MGNGVAVLVIIVIILIIAALVGNISIVMSIIQDDATLISENGFLVSLTVIVDLILLYLLVKKIKNPTIKSLQTAKKGVVNYYSIKRQSRKIRKFTSNENLCIERLHELRALNMNANAIRRTQKFCRLIETTTDSSEIQECMKAVNVKLSVVNEIYDLEQELLDMANSYKKIGNYKKCKFYLSYIEKSNKNFCETFEMECKEQLLEREKEKKAIKMWLSLSLITIITIIIITTGIYIGNVPYRQIKERINNQALTVEMLDWNNRESENSYYEYLSDEKGCEFLADVFTELHRKNDIEKAMWLLCIQPDCIDGIDLCASDSFIDWVVDYAKDNGTKKEHSDGDITYTVNGYEVSISSIFDTSIGHYFRISNGTESTSVEKRNSYYEGSVPTIR